MAKRVPISDRSKLFRDPDEWARDWGWISGTQAANRAQDIRDVADAIERTMGDDDEAAFIWCLCLRRAADKLDPMKNPRAKAYRERAEKKIAAQREP